MVKSVGLLWLQGNLLFGKFLIHPNPVGNISRREGPEQESIVDLDLGVLEPSKYWLSICSGGFQGK